MYNARTMSEANNRCEIEASAPLLEKIIEDNKINGVLFDLDGTLFDTHEYFLSTENSLSLDLAERFKSTIPSNNFVEAMADIMSNEWVASGFKPILIEQRYLNALKIYFNGENSSCFREYQNFVKVYLRNFYDISPDIINGSVEVLSLIKDMGLCFAFNSNAQESWTKIKVLKFTEELKMHAIPYNAVDIDCVKDAQSWSKAARFIGTNTSESLIIGDSLSADILSAIESGCKNLVWIKGDLEKLPDEIKNNSDIHIWCVDSVKDLLSY